MSKFSINKLSNMAKRFRYLSSFGVEGLSDNSGNESENSQVVTEEQPSTIGLEESGVEIEEQPSVIGPEEPAEKISDKEFLEEITEDFKQIVKNDTVYEVINKSEGNVRSKTIIVFDIVNKLTQLSGTEDFVELLDFYNELTNSGEIDKGTLNEFYEVIKNEELENTISEEEEEKEEIIPVPKKEEVKEESSYQSKVNHMKSIIEGKLESYSDDPTVITNEIRNAKIQASAIATQRGKRGLNSRIYDPEKIAEAKELGDELYTLERKIGGYNGKLEKDISELERLKSENKPMEGYDHEYRKTHGPSVPVSAYKKGDKKAIFEVSNNIEDMKNWLLATYEDAISIMGKLNELQPDEGVSLGIVGYANAIKDLLGKKKPVFFGDKVTAKDYHSKGEFKSHTSEVDVDSIVAKANTIKGRHGKLRREAESVANAIKLLEIKRLTLSGNENVESAIEIMWPGVLESLKQASEKGIDISQIDINPKTMSTEDVKEKIEKAKEKNEEFDKSLNWRDREERARENITKWRQNISLYNPLIGKELRSFQKISENDLPKLKEKKVGIESELEDFQLVKNWAEIDEKLKNLEEKQGSLNYKKNNTKDESLIPQIQAELNETENNIKSLEDQIIKIRQDIDEERGVKKISIEEGRENEKIKKELKENRKGFKIELGKLKELHDIVRSKYDILLKLEGREEGGGDLAENKIKKNKLILQLNKFDEPKKELLEKIRAIDDQLRSMIPIQSLDFNNAKEELLKLEYNLKEVNHELASVYRAKEENEARHNLPLDIPSSEEQITALEGNNSQKAKAKLNSIINAPKIKDKLFLQLEGFLQLDLLSRKIVKSDKSDSGINKIVKYKMVPKYTGIEPLFIEVEELYPLADKVNSEVLSLKYFDSEGIELSNQAIENKYKEVDVPSEDSTNLVSIEDRRNFDKILDEFFYVEFNRFPDDVAENKGSLGHSGENTKIAEYKLKPNFKIKELIDWKVFITSTTSERRTLNTINNITISPRPSGSSREYLTPGEALKILDGFVVKLNKIGETEIIKGEGAEVGTIAEGAIVEKTEYEILPTKLTLKEKQDFTNFKVIETKVTYEDSKPIITKVVVDKNSGEEFNYDSFIKSKLNDSARDIKVTKRKKENLPWEDPNFKKFLDDEGFKFSNVENRKQNPKSKELDKNIKEFRDAIRDNDLKLKDAELSGKSSWINKYRKDGEILNKEYLRLRGQRLDTYPNKRTESSVRESEGVLVFGPQEAATVLIQDNGEDKNGERLVKIYAKIWPSNNSDKFQYIATRKLDRNETHSTYLDSLKFIKTSDTYVINKIIDLARGELYQDKNKDRKERESDIEKNKEKLQELQKGRGNDIVEKDPSGGLSGYVHGEGYDFKNQEFNDQYEKAYESAIEENRLIAKIDSDYKDLLANVTKPELKEIYKGLTQRIAVLTKETANPEQGMGVGKNISNLDKDDRRNKIEEKRKAINIQKLIRRIVSGKSNKQKIPKDNFSLGPYMGMIKYEPMSGTANTQNPYVGLNIGPFTLPKELSTSKKDYDPFVSKELFEKYIGQLIYNHLKKNKLKWNDEGDSKSTDVNIKLTIPTDKAFKSMIINYKITIKNGDYSNPIIEKV